MPLARAHRMQQGYPLVIVLLFLTPVHSHRAGAFSWFSTIAEMKNLTAQDLQLMELLQRRVATGKLHVNQLLNTILDLRKTGEDMLKKYDKSGWSTIDAAFQDRYQKLWKDFEKHSDFAFDRRSLQMYKTTVDEFPQEEDMQAVLGALFNLQKSYRLNATQLAEGVIFGKYAGGRLSASCCAYMTHIACGKRILDQCKEWGKIATSRLEKGEESDFSLEDIEDMVTDAQEEKLFLDLCARAVSANYVESSANGKLKCYMWHNFHHPWLLVQPVKMEVMSQSPDIAVFYEVLSDRDIKHLKNEAESRLGIAKTFDLEESVEVDSHRVAHNCWLSRARDSVISRMEGLVSAITGLQVRQASEQLQVANYGIGGHYSAHIDPMSYSAELEMKRTNRKATFMFYLTDVEHGGATVFLSPKIGVKPVKGSAVFWHNLLPSGFADERTKHGGCPVLLGDKWVANKWIWETGREMCKPKAYIGRFH